MADILRITTPLVDKTPLQPNKPVVDPTVPFALSDLSKVIQTDAQNPMQGEQNKLKDKESSPTILMDMLKDPAVTVGFLKNILLLEEIVNLLPVNNTALTQEIEQMFAQLLVKPEEIVKELLRQETASTSFKGEFFEVLRTMIKENPSLDIKNAVANLLKSLNGAKTQVPILDSVANSLQFLSKSVSGNQTLADTLTQLAKALRTPSAPAAFIPLKAEIMEALKQVQDSILFTPKLQKIVPLIIYNLSRFQDNPDFLKEATGALISSLNGDEKRELVLQLLQREINLPRGKLAEPSQVMEVIAKIIGKQVSEEQIATLSGDKLEKIIHSLLSSPCNYTPLLHFIVPVETAEMRSFAEIWIDPNNEEKTNASARQKQEDSMHVLAIFDVESIGRFEAEIFTFGNEITLALMCPQAYISAFENIGTKIKPMLEKAGLILKETKVAPLIRQRSLMDVFKELPHKRTGIDVKI